MKTKLLFFFILLSAFANAQGVWTQKANVGETTRYGAVSFSIAGKLYLGTGTDNSVGLNDFWEYDPVLDTWTQKANFPGGARFLAVGFSINNLGYIGAGVPVGTGNRYNDLWEYNPVLDNWTPKASFPGLGKESAVGFSIGSKGYIGLGFNDNGLSNDFWEWDQSTNTWSLKANFGGTARRNAVGFSIGSKGYIGTGNDINGSRNDFWEWDQSTNIWTQKANFGGVQRDRAVGFPIGTKGYIGTGILWNGSIGMTQQDFWEWDQSTNVWTQKANFGGGARSSAVGFSFGTKGYFGTGNYSAINNDFWEYDPNAVSGINEIKSQNSMTIFPNPFSVETSLKMIEGFKNATLTIYNAFGKQVMQMKNISGSTIILQRNNLASGMYLISLTQDNKAFTANKLIITD